MESHSSLLHTFRLVSYAGYHENLTADISRGNIEHMTHSIHRHFTRKKHLHLIRNTNEREIIEN